jgi:D-alanyl-D-alanine carboxypeptidase
MSRMRIFWGTVGLLLVAAAAATGLLLEDRPGAGPVERASGSEHPTAEPARDARSRSRTLSIRRRGGVPAAWVDRLRGAPGVTAVARTGRTQALLRRSTRGDGATVDAPPGGYALPLDVLVVRPRSFSKALPAAARPALRRLRPGTALLSRTSARLRRLGTGGRLTLADGRTLRVAGIVDDELVRTAELVVRPGDAGGAALRAAQLVVVTTQPRRIAAALPSTRDTRIRSFLPGARAARGGIAWPAELKARFGEFAVRLPYGEDWIGIERGWLRRNVVTRAVPIVGRVTCNRRFIPPLRRALAEIQRRGLSRLVDPGDYAGCYAPRRIPGSGSPSLHAWGLAIDLNAASNPQFGVSRHDPRLVRAMERAGFTWGGRWPTAPDPMHFELQAPPER